MIVSAKSAVISLAFFLLGGTVAVALGATTLQAALYDGIAVPVLVTTAASSTPSPPAAQQPIGSELPGPPATTLEPIAVDDVASSKEKAKSTETPSRPSIPTYIEKDGDIIKRKPTAMTTMEYLSLLTWRGVVQAKAGMGGVTRWAPEVPRFLKRFSKSGQPKRLRREERKKLNE